MTNLYKQVKIQYDLHDPYTFEKKTQFEICWIPEHFAKNNKSIIVDMGKSSWPGTVVEVLSDKSYTREQLEINRKYPLREATDI